MNNHLISSHQDKQASKIQGIHKYIIYIIHLLQPISLLKNLGVGLKLKIKNNLG